MPPRFGDRLRRGAPEAPGFGSLWVGEHVLIPGVTTVEDFRNCQAQLHASARARGLDPAPSRLLPNAS
jgi:hypothetical protein